MSATNLEEAATVASEFISSEFFVFETADGARIVWALCCLTPLAKQVESLSPPTGANEL